MPKERTRPDLADTAIIAVARDQLVTIEEREQWYRPLALIDLEFSVGDQWPMQMRASREAGPSPRPCLVINRTEEFVLREVNEFRKNRPAIKVSPLGDESNIETAEVIQGIVRHIERESNADIVYETGVDHQMRMGRGYWRIILDFADPMSFDLVPRLRRIRNSFSIFLDPHAQEPDGSDATHGFIITRMSKAAFERMWPNADLSNFPALVNSKDEWFERDSIRVAEYFFTEWYDEEIAMLRDGSIVPERQVSNKSLIIETRTTKIPQVWQTKINGLEVLEIFKWPGKFIPIIPVSGTEEEVNGRLTLKGMVRNMIDPARMYNYLASLETELVAMAPKAPHIGAEGAFEGHEIAWREANVRNWPYLQYKPTVGPNGQLNPPPQRQVFEPPIQAITQQRLLALEDLRGTVGFRVPMNQPIGNETDRLAKRRQGQIDDSNFHYMSNANRAIRHTGRILVDLIPKVYNRKRVVRIIGEDDIEEVITVNAEFQREGKKTLFDLTAGQFDVAISSGPSFTTKREQAAEGLVRLTTAYPNLVQLIGDIMVRNMDIPEAQEAAERIRRSIPPEILGSDEEPTPEQLQAMVKQLQGQLEQLNAYAVEREQEAQQSQQAQALLTQQLGDKNQEHDLKMAQLTLSREELALKAQTDNRKLDIEEQTKNRDLDLEAVEVAAKAEQNGF